MLALGITTVADSNFNSDLQGLLWITRVEPNRFVAEAMNTIR
jgi:hypothetical protein